MGLDLHRFILEGLATVVAGAASFFIIQDFPDTASFLSEAEREMVIRRLQGDDQFSAGGEQFKLQSIICSLKDGKRGLAVSMVSVTSSKARLVLTRATTLVGMYVGSIMPLYAFSLFLPSILHGVRHRSVIEFPYRVSSSSVSSFCDKILNNVPPFSHRTQGTKQRPLTFSRSRCTLSLALSPVLSALRGTN